MIENFPRLDDKQVALIRTELNTGHVLDEEFHLAINENQKVFTVYNNIDEAKMEALKILEKRKDTELVIYDYKQSVLLCLNNVK